jgi:hypothetical protein
MLTLTTDNFKSNSSPFISDPEMTKMLETLIVPQYQSNIYDWVYYAKPNEKKGLYILMKVINHKGEQMFRTQLTKTREEENDISRLTMEEAFKRYQQKKSLSSYSEYFGGNMDQKYKYNNILKYKDFEHV